MIAVYLPALIEPVARDAYVTLSAVPFICVCLTWGTATWCHRSVLSDSWHIFCNLALQSELHSLLAKSCLSCSGPGRLRWPNAGPEAWQGMTFSFLCLSSSTGLFCFCVSVEVPKNIYGVIRCSWVEANSNTILVVYINIFHRRRCANTYFGILTCGRSTTFHLIDP